MVSNRPTIPFQHPSPRHSIKAVHSKLTNDNTSVKIKKSSPKVLCGGPQLTLLPFPGTPILTQWREREKGMGLTPHKNYGKKNWSGHSPWQFDQVGSVSRSGNPALQT
jgi:hypothetical protein